eukprot:scaffold58322_cov67-Phaeocystis_antarctica.AAC.1
MNRASSSWPLILARSAGVLSPCEAIRVRDRVRVRVRVSERGWGLQLQRSAYDMAHRGPRLC